MKKSIILTLLSIFLLAGCHTANQPKETNSKGMLIYTSIYPIEYFTERIGGNDVNAKTIIPPGADAHTYEPTAKTLTDIAQGKAFIYLGGDMEAFAKTTADALQNEPVKLVELAKHKDLFLKDKHPDPDEHGDLDPHIWLDPIRAIQMADIIKQQLITMDPSHKDEFEKNYQTLEADLKSLDKSFQKMIKDKQNKTILVSHAAYGYWEDRYGIKQLAIRGLTPGAEPSQKDLEAIIQTVKEKHIPYVIFEQNTSDRIAKVIQNELGIKALRIHNLSVRTKDDIKNKEDYLSLMKRNISVLDQALTSKE